MQPLLIVDGDNLAHRAYHSTPKTVTSDDGKPINAFVGFIGMLINVYQREQPRSAFIAWDTLGVDTYRSELWPQYQTGRVFDPEIVEQLDAFPGLCRAFGFGVGKKAGYEADDLMAAAACKEVENGGTCLILTTDRDSFQLVNNSVTILVPQRGGKDPERIGPREVVQRLGVLPEQVCDYKALCGDPSDRIPGARGIGPRSAASLLLKHGLLEGVLENWGRASESDQILMFREVVRMRPDVPVDLPTGPPDWRAGAEALRRIGAERMAERVAAMTE